AAVHAARAGAAVAAHRKRPGRDSLRFLGSWRRASRPGFSTTLVALQLAWASGSALARSGAGPEGRLILGPDGPHALMSSAAAGGNGGAPPSDRWTNPKDGPSRRATALFAVPLPEGAVQIDSTWYDLQDMGSLGHRIEVGADGRVHVTWQDDFCEL